MSESLLRKVTGLHPSVLSRKELWNRCFPVHFVKFLRETFYRTIRSSRQELFCKIGVLRNVPKFIGKHLYLSLNKVAGLRPTTLLKKRLWHRCFPVTFLKFLTTPFLQNTSGRLLLLIADSIILLKSANNINHRM